MKKKKSLVLLLLAVGSLLVTGGAAAAPALDQRQTTLDEDFTVLIGGDGPQIPGQVVRSGMAGILTAVELPVGCDTPSTSLVVQILDASDCPGTTVIASHTVSGLTDELDWTSIAIPAQPFIPAETQFAIALSSQGWCGIVSGPFEADPYPRGSGWYQGPPYPPGFWAPAGADLGFKTYVERMCKVPRILELSQDEARTLIDTYGCTPGAVRPMHSQTVPQGQVISQEQAEGTMLPPRSRVNFAVSLGPRPCRVPPVRGRKLSVARAAITRRACTVGRVTRVRSQKVKRGRVVSQSPRPGTALPNLGKVNLVVSRGPSR
jgi:PASTA domain